MKGDLVEVGDDQEQFDFTDLSRVFTVVNSTLTNIIEKFKPEDPSMASNTTDSLQQENTIQETCGDVALSCEDLTKVILNATSEQVALDETWMTNIPKTTVMDINTLSSPDTAKMDYQLLVKSEENRSIIPVSSITCNTQIQTVSEIISKEEAAEEKKRIQDEKENHPTTRQ
eukprot:CAMPEP_0170511464 /NCGR_PEP_ID=MMETSP0208-20121228/66321_1 /TAXON_ID=197538 /ORGANISM="Strombidium inclinatum, Strain S3" /LENGTH=171 /DNA_ID=CAMNT_0010795011 /DNA_START=1728 /DNA_END=2243 /DNA_ORIENTATION=-